jgi:hypothetical protein
MNASERNHPTWTHAFTQETREEQIHDDAAAWRAVTGILLTIVTAGVVLALFAVWLCI